MKKLISLLLRFVPRRYLQLISGAGLRLVGWFYAGNQVVCPICGSHFRKFLPYGRIHPRANALCPTCLSLERHRLIWLYLTAKTNFFSSQLDVLHVAPEKCLISRFEKMHREKYVTADIESSLAKVKMDIHHIPFPENKFDVVLCNHVLEHVQDDIRAMHEIKRVLKPGGWAIMQVPFFAPIPEVTFEDASVTGKREREKVFGQDDHVRLFGKDYPARIERAGLKAVGEKFGIDMPEETRRKHGLASGEIIYIGKKQ